MKEGATLSPQCDSWTHTTWGLASGARCSRVRSNSCHKLEERPPAFQERTRKSGLTSSVEHAAVPVAEVWVVVVVHTRALYVVR